MLHQKFGNLVAVTKQSATPSLDTNPSEQDPSKGNLVPGNEVEETMFKLLEPGDDAETDAGRNPLAEASPSVVTDAGGHPRGESQQLGKTEPTIPHQEEITTCSRIFQKGPNCEFAGMTKTTRARREKKTSETRRWELTSNLIQRTIYRGPPKS